MWKLENMEKTWRKSKTYAQIFIVKQNKHRLNKCLCSHTFFAPKIHERNFSLSHNLCKWNKKNYYNNLLRFCFLLLFLWKLIFLFLLWKIFFHWIWNMRVRNFVCQFYFIMLRNLDNWKWGKCVFWGNFDGVES